jgi:hypothetical protein
VTAQLELDSKLGSKLSTAKPIHVATEHPILPASAISKDSSEQRIDGTHWSIFWLDLLLSEAPRRIQGYKSPVVRICMYIPSVACCART